MDIPASGNEKESKDRPVVLAPESAPEVIQAPEVVLQGNGEHIDDLKVKIEKMELDEVMNTSVVSSAQNMQSLTQEQKINNLLMLVKQKGVVYAVHVAKNMNDPYVLDMLHDRLAKEGHYKDFKQ